MATSGNQSTIAPAMPTMPTNALVSPDYVTGYLEAAQRRADRNQTKAKPNANRQISVSLGSHNCHRLNKMNARLELWHQPGQDNAAYTQCGLTYCQHFSEFPSGAASAPVLSPHHPQVCKCECVCVLRKFAYLSKFYFHFA